MAYINKKYYTAEKNIFVYSTNNDANRNATVDNTYIQTDTDGNKTVSEGLFVARIGSTFRYLPRFTLTTATATNSASVVGTPVNVIKAGDVLRCVEPYAVINLGGTVAEAETVTVTIAGNSVVSTAATAVLADLATLVATNLNADPITSQLVTAIATGSDVYVFAKDGITNHAIAVTEAGAAVTIAIAGGATALGFAAALGTVSSVDIATNTITLSGNASAVLPVGAHVGVAVDEVLGVDARSRDFTTETTQIFGVYNVSSGVRESYLPYVDGDVKRRLPQLLFVNKA